MMGSSCSWGSGWGVERPNLSETASVMVCALRPSGVCGWVGGWVKTWMGGEPFCPAIEEGLACNRMWADGAVGCILQKGCILLCNSMLCMGLTQNVP